MGHPTSLAQFAIRLMAVQAGEQDPVLSQEMAQEMLTVQIDGRGLGPELADEGGDRVYFSHSGDNDGYKAFLVACPQRGQGVVIMTNSDNGVALYDEILKSVSAVYGLTPGFSALHGGIAAAVLIVVLAFLILLRRRAKSSASKPKEDP